MMMDGRLRMAVCTGRTIVRTTQSKTRFLLTKMADRLRGYQGKVGMVPSSLAGTSR